MIFIVLEPRLQRTLLALLLGSLCGFLVATIIFKLHANSYLLYNNCAVGTSTILDEPSRKTEGYVEKFSATLTVHEDHTVADTLYNEVRVLCWIM